LTTTVQKLHEELIVDIYSDVMAKHAMHGTRHLSENLSRLSNSSGLN